MPPPNDITGMKYGRLTAVRFVERRQVGKQSKRFWLFSCDCGTIVERPYGAVTSGNTLSCGCLLKDTITKHGASDTQIYSVWHAMMTRCRNDYDPAFKDYGGRGITVCARWHDFGNFTKDMGPRPTGGTLDRIDVNGNYEPSNCRWTDAKTQGNNRRNNIRITLNGETRTIAQWADHLGVGKARISQRLKAGWPIEAALTEPFQRGKKKHVKSRSMLSP